MRVQHDILNAIGGQQAVLLVLLHLSAAFDTVSHAELISTLQRHGITGRALPVVRLIPDRPRAIHPDRPQQIIIRAHEVWRAARVGPRADPVHNLHRITGQPIPLSQQGSTLAVFRYPEHPRFSVGIPDSPAQ